MQGAEKFAPCFFASEVKQHYLLKISEYNRTKLYFTVKFIGNPLHQGVVIVKYKEICSIKIGLKICSRNKLYGGNNQWL